MALCVHTQSGPSSLCHHFVLKWLTWSHKMGHHKIPLTGLGWLCNPTVKTSTGTVYRLKLLLFLPWTAAMSYCDSYRNEPSCYESQFFWCVLTLLIHVCFLLCFSWFEFSHVCNHISNPNLDENPGARRGVWRTWRFWGLMGAEDVGGWWPRARDQHVVARLHLDFEECQRTSDIKI